MSFPPPGNRDFTERDMVKVAAMHAESQAEIVALRARVAELESLVKTGDWLAAAIERARPVGIAKEVIQALISWQNERAANRGKR